MNMMKYRGYIATIEFDDEDHLFVGHLAGINDIVSFHDSSVDELETAFHEAVDEYIAISEQTGRPVQRSYSGNLMLRVTPEIHAAAAISAKAKGKSLNQWAADYDGHLATIPSADFCSITHKVTSVGATGGHSIYSDKWMRFICSAC